MSEKSSYDPNSSELASLDAEIRLLRQMIQKSTNSPALVSTLVNSLCKTILAMDQAQARRNRWLHVDQCRLVFSSLTASISEVLQRYLPDGEWQQAQTEIAEHFCEHLERANNTETQIRQLTDRQR